VKFFIVNQMQRMAGMLFERRVTYVVQLSIPTFSFLVTSVKVRLVKINLKDISELQKKYPSL